MGRLWQQLWRDHYVLWASDTTHSRSWGSNEEVTWSWVREQSASVWKIG